jgi:hypothetical protein
VLPPGIRKGDFQLSMDSVWFCKVLLLFSFESASDQGRQQHDCAFVSVLEEYTGLRRPGCICLASTLHHLEDDLLHSNSLARAEWIERADSKMIYERKPSSPVLYVLPITHILGKLPVVPVGDTGTFPHSMRGESAEYDGASCDSEPGKGDGCRWWYVSSWAMSWSSRM